MKKVIFSLGVLLIGVVILFFGVILFFRGSAEMEYVLEHKREFFPWDENFTGTLGWCGTSWSDAYMYAEVTRGIGIIGIGTGMVGIGIGVVLAVKQRLRKKQLPSSGV